MRAINAPPNTFSACPLSATSWKKVFRCLAIHARSSKLNVFNRAEAGEVLSLTIRILGEFDARVRADTQWRQSWRGAAVSSQSPTSKRKSRVSGGASRRHFRRGWKKPARFSDAVAVTEPARTKSGDNNKSD